MSSLIVVALKGVLFQVFDLPSIWRCSRLDGIVWLATYLSVVLIEIDIGLLVGVAASILALLARGLTANVATLQRLPNTDIYVDSAKYDKASHFLYRYILLTFLILKISAEYLLNTLELIHNAFPSIPDVFSLPSHAFYFTSFSGHLRYTLLVIFPLFLF